ncbi:MAG: hypothetical protein IBX62_00370 [Coriobacteriia bacterium]|nr:hypothetical protein [Coriobacteriia bacterium]
MSLDSCHPLRVAARGLPWVAFVTLALALSAPADARAAEAHGPYSFLSSKCVLCHAPHVAASPDNLFVASTPKTLCYSCHDGTGSVYDTRSAFGETVEGSSDKTSRHPVPEGALQCRDCHSAHADPASRARLLAAGESHASTGTAVCGSCHGSGSGLPGGDLTSGLAGTGHATLGSVPSAADIACVACHEPHGSARPQLLREVVMRSNGTTRTAADDKALCLACHEVRQGDYPGESVASAGKHSTTLSSTKAAVSYPGSGRPPGDCMNCHEPHGTTGNGAYARKPGSELCGECHDAAGAVYPSGYSYRGAGAMSVSGHVSVDSGLGYASLSCDSEGFAAWESVAQPTPSAPGQPIALARLGGMRSMDSSVTVTSLASVTGEYDYQMYRFRVEQPRADVRGLAAVWRGFGEEKAGNPVVVSVWDNSTSSWHQFANRQMVDPTTSRLELEVAKHLDANGDVYLLAGARNSQDTDLVSGPTLLRLSDTSVRIDWTTSGPSDSWVDYGATSAYGTTVGTSTRATSHSVTLSGLSERTYHYRVRSASGDGDSYVSPDFTLGLPGPVLTPVPDQEIIAPVTVAFAWTVPSEEYRPFRYRVQVRDWSGAEVWSTWTDDVTSASTVLGVGSYRWRVEAVDKDEFSYGWSNEDIFYLYESGSCPFLFTWDGERFGFEADLYGAGKLGVVTKDGYLKPEPNDHYVLRHEPALRDGRYELRLVEERAEIDYLDELRLYAVDAPAGRRVMAEKPQAGEAPFPGLEKVLHTIAEDAPAPRSVVHVNTGRDVTAEIASDDDVCVVLNEDRNVDFDYQTLELDLGDVSAEDHVRIAMDAVSMFPNTAEGKKRSASFGARTKLEVQDADGNWVLADPAKATLPKAPEFSRPYVFDISDIWVSDSRKVRFTFLFKTYVDWIAVDTSADVPVKITELPMASAGLRLRGLDPRDGEEERYEYVYGEPTGRTAYLPGAYTRFGDVRELLERTDDMFVIYGGGDEIALSFEPIAPAAEGEVRYFLAYTNGYYKNTKIRGSLAVEPLPFAEMSNYPYGADESYPDDEAHREYRSEWNTRVVGEDEVLATPSAAEDDGSPPRLLAAVGSFLERIWDGLVSLFAPSDPRVASGGAGTGDSGEEVHRSLNTDYVGLEISFPSANVSGSCLACHAVHGQEEGGQPLRGSTWGRDARVCTADGTGCHAEATSSVSGVDILGRFTASGDARAHHDVMPWEQERTGARIECSSCHNPHLDRRDVQVVDPYDKSVAVPPTFSRFIDGSNDVYVLVGADHDGNPPVVSNRRTDVSTGWRTPTVRWSTNEPADSWVDYGTDTTYGSGTVGSGTLTTSHAVLMPTLTDGVTWYMRVRTVDAVGNEAVSEFTYFPVEPPPAPTLVPVGDKRVNGFWGPSTVDVTFSWSAVTCPDGDPVEYVFELRRNGVVWTTVTTAETTHTVTGLTGGDDYQPTVLYTWQVRSRDTLHTDAVSPWAQSSFYVTDVEPSGSCPFLFTWDGEDHAFEADLYGAGKLAAKTKDGYLRPEPRDAYVLRSEPALRDGLYDLRLVEERAEVDYLDELKLYAVDAPADRLVIAEKPQAGGKAYGPLDEVVQTIAADAPPPVSAVHVQAGLDVLELIAKDDDECVVLNEDRNVDFDYQTLELDLGDLAGAESVRIAMDAVSMFPDTPEGTARSASFGARTKLEVQDAEGNWVTAEPSKATLPKAPEFSRPYVFDVSDIWVSDSRKVRFTFLFKTYVDWIAVDTSEDVPVAMIELPLVSAELRVHGIDDKSGRDERYEYVYGEGNGVTLYMPGAYTRLGDVRELLDACDDKFVIYGGGDELALSFEPAAEPGSGTRRSFVMYTNGYYKDNKVDVPHAVEPLPFAAMSNFPYGEDEHYPDDEEHLAYLAEWNTRVVDEDDAMAGSTSSASAVGAVGEGRDAPSLWQLVFGRTWGELMDDVAAPATEETLADDDAVLPPSETETPAAETSVAGAGEGEWPDTVEHYSLNTDRLVLAGVRTSASQLVITPVQGWESEGSATAPTPSAPGSEVAEGVLTRVGVADEQYWRTDLASSDRRWNWQVARFRITPEEIGALKDFRVLWTGYGEPTPGYATKVAIWDPATTSWVWLHTRDALGATANLAYFEGGTPDSFCLACHDGSTPEGVTLPSGVTNIGANWGATSKADFHGARAGTGYSGSTGGMAPPYRRGMAALPCVTCHDPHGSGNLFHIADNVNERTGIVAVSGNGMKDLCYACHTGTVDQWHKECLDCHNGGWGHGDVYVDSPETYGGQNYPNANSDCRLCHNHGSKSNVHSDGGRGVDEREQIPSWCDHYCHHWDTTF